MKLTAEQIKAKTIAEAETVRAISKNAAARAKSDFVYAFSLCRLKSEDAMNLLRAWDELKTAWRAMRRSGGFWKRPAPGPPRMTKSGRRTTRPGKRPRCRL